MRLTLRAGSACALLALAACGAGTPGGTANPSTTAGTLMQAPPLRVASLNRDDLAAQLGASSDGRQLLAMAGAPACGVDFHYFQYRTTGGAGEPTSASGALMLPTGGGACSGPRPVLLYTHGTAVTHGYNIAAITDPANEGWAESAIMAAFFAARGYIVVASNYAGYDSSPLPYHPYTNARQQSHEMIDALAAARAALAAGLPAGVTDNGQLFITGYSEGGHVAMATHRAMEAAGMHVTAAAPMSGPYAMLAFGDAVFAHGQVGFGGSVYYPLVINSYQHAYGDLYATPAEVYDPNYASAATSLLPGPYDANTLFSTGKLPMLAIFDSATPRTGDAALDAALAVPDATVNPIAALGFGQPALFRNSFRAAYARDALAVPDGALQPGGDLMPPSAEPASPMRRALKKNDLRGWQPRAPVMLCGGMNDPDVNYPVNTLTMKGLWAAQVTSDQVRVLDVDPTSNGELTSAGQVATIVGGIVAQVVAAAPDAAGAQQSAAVRAAVAAYFPATAPGPQRAMALGLASVAAQAVDYFRARGVTGAEALASQVGQAIMANYHYPLVQSACEVAAQSYFARFVNGATP
ncbi:prolyl oligopeptidase family serine peptidase [Duganella sp. FT3S]|uniref:Prolyl oligopeptidase family serine peptidase n=1 Tax=Rugamonas fusca TaxID=2758568 RepID=A0A7W2I888_9BURK|nr:prolyl oligopeptidase family serine peptidase [Rugamonas fusca]MBA5607113.1 prolyl oligopeptidase family serine peptidase [Rugamonas fusca]